MLNVLSGWETANIKSFPIAEGQKLDQGDWVVFEDGKLVKQSGQYSPIDQGACFPVYAGNVSFYDTRYHNRADVVTANSGVLETDKVAAVAITAGAALTVKDGVVDLATTNGDADIIGFAIEDMKNGVVKFALA